MGDSKLISLAFPVVVILLLVTYFIWFFRKSKNLLYAWAAGHDFKIVSSELRLLWFFKGPYSLTSERWQTVYRVVVENSQGHRRIGWVRLGDPLFGLFVRKVDVTWENDSQRLYQKKETGEIKGGAACVRCEKIIDPNLKACPFCGWTQP